MNIKDVTCVVVLEVMWGDRVRPKETAPRYYTINPHNKSGKLLYKILDGQKFLVTNACKELVTGPNQRGIPDPIWLANNLNELKHKYNYLTLLVCGSVAWNTYIMSKTNYKLPNTRVVKLKHPAARNWTKQEIIRWKEYLK